MTNEKLKKFRVYGSGRTHARHPSRGFTYRERKGKFEIKVETYDEGSPMALPSVWIQEPDGTWYASEESTYFTKEEEEEFLGCYLAAYRSHVEHNGEGADDRFHELPQKILDGFIDAQPGHTLVDEGS